MQNLILDFGNTLFKAAVFDKGEMLYRNSGTQLRVDDLKALKQQFPQLSQVIYSRVIDLNPELEDFLQREFHCLEFKSDTPIPIQNQYKTPESLGLDRLAAAVGASILFPKKELLVIDAGSSITYERLTKKGIYLGGAISPGIQMRFKSLHHFTGKLPLIHISSGKTNLLGQNTEESILSGVLNGILAEVNGIIRQYKKAHPDILIIFTGGDLKYFDKNLKNNIFAAENLVLQGLNFILEYNDNKTA